MDGLRWTACKKRLGDGAMDSSAMLQWTACNGQLGAMNGSAMDGLAMDSYGSAIKRWTARQSHDGQLAMDEGWQWTAWR